MYRLRERSKRQQLLEDVENLPTVPFEVEEPLPATSPTQHHHISMDNHQKVRLFSGQRRIERIPLSK
jgi:hypothetical protein